jgi:hypothetical protein
VGRLRSIQSRLFDTADQNKAMRAVIATLQDLGFVVDRANDALGLVSATKLSGYVLKMTVSVRPHGESPVLVRANAQYNIKALEDPEPYQRFFEAFNGEGIEKSLTCFQPKESLPIKRFVFEL